MKNVSTAVKMRWVAGGLYAAVSLVRLLSFYYILEAAAITNLPIVWVVDILMVPLFAAVAVWLFAGNKPLSANTGRGVLVGTVLVVAYELLFYSVHTEAIALTFTYKLPSLAANVAIWKLVAVLVYVMLLILAAFFVLSSRDVDKEKLQAEAEAGVAVAMAEAAIAQAEVEAIAEAIEEWADAVPGGEKDEDEEDEKKE